MGIHAFERNDHCWFRQYVNLDTAGEAADIFRCFWFLHPDVIKELFFKEHFNHDSFSNFLPPWSQHLFLKHTLCLGFHEEPRAVMPGSWKCVRIKQRGSSPRHQNIFCWVCEGSGVSLALRATDGQSWPQASSWNFLMLFNLWMPYLSLPDWWSFLAEKSLG